MHSLINPEAAWQALCEGLESVITTSSRMRVMPPQKSICQAYMSR